MPEDNVPTVITDNENVINEEAVPSVRTEERELKDKESPAAEEEKPVAEPQTSPVIPQPTEPTPPTPPVQQPAPETPVEPTTAPEPIIETPPPIVVEPAPEPEATPPIAPAPAVKVEEKKLKDEVAAPTVRVEERELKDKELPAAEEEVPVPEPQASPVTPQPEEPAPPLPPSPSEKGIPQKVLDLTPEELDAARRLWAREHIGQAQKKANESRHARMMERMAEIEKFVKAYPGCSVHEAALEIGLSEKLTSGYLQKLVHAGRLKASGNTMNRRFSAR